VCILCIKRTLELCLQGSALCEHGGTIIGMVHDGAEVRELLVEVLDLGGQFVQMLVVI
jgi:hypothetical protein